MELDLVEFAWSLSLKNSKNHGERFAAGENGLDFDQNTTFGNISFDNCVCIGDFWKAYKMNLRPKQCIVGDVDVQLYLLYTWKALHLQPETGVIMSFHFIPRTDDGQCIVRARTNVEVGEAVAAVVQGLLKDLETC